MEVTVTRYKIDDNEVTNTWDEDYAIAFFCVATKLSNGKPASYSVDWGN